MSEALGAGDGRLWRPEWWERLTDAREAWSDQHAGVRHRLRQVRNAALWTAFAVLLLVTLTSGEMRAALGAWLGSAWVAFLLLLVLRTKTLGWSAFWWVFTASLLWSVVVGLVLRVAADTVTGAGVDSPGPAVAIASLGEESLKLVPLLVVALLAPARVQRFGVADWMLLGVASGAAFTAVEESLRRVTAIGVDGGDLPAHFTRFGLWGLELGYGGVHAYPGHHAATAVIGAAIGVGVVLVRRGSRDIGLRRLGWTLGGIVVPVVAWWLFVVRHATLNAYVSEVGLPGPMDLTERVLPDSWGRLWTVVAVVLVVQLVDARHLARWGDAALEGGTPPDWLVSTLETCEAWRAQGPFGRCAAPVVEAATHLGHVVTRDTRQVLAASTAEGDVGDRWSGVRASRTLVSMQREMRQIVQHLDGEPSRPWRVRAVALLALAVVVVTSVVVAPAVAAAVQASVVEAGAWMAGMIARFGPWWDSLSGWQRITVGTGALAALGVSSATLGPSTSSVRDAAPLGAAVTLGQAAVAVGLRGVGVAGSPDVLVATASEYHADPVAWRAEQVVRLTADG